MPSGIVFGDFARCTVRKLRVMSCGVESAETYLRKPDLIAGLWHNYRRRQVRAEIPNEAFIVRSFRHSHDTHADHLELR